jgi:hypothetical protein
LPRRKLNKCKKETPYAGNLRKIGQIHAPDLPRQTWDQQQNIQKELASKTKKTQAIMTPWPLGLSLCPAVSGGLDILLGDQFRPKLACIPPLLTTSEELGGKKP